MEKCELCGKETDDLSECEDCGRLICDDCGGVCFLCDECFEERCVRNDTYFW